MDRLTLRVHWLSRIAMAVTALMVGLLLLGLVVYPLWSSDLGQVVGTVVVLALAVLATVRFCLVGVDATADSVKVRGFLLTRRIPLGSITDVPRYSTVIHWIDAGNRRVTRMWWFNSATRFPPANKHSEAAMLDLADWVERHQAELNAHPSHSRARHRKRGRHR